VATFRDLEQQNPNIREQYDTWRSERRAKGEDENDWAAFRAHLMAIGAPDPGESPLEDSAMHG
jgi:hypothetical protein